MSEAKHTPLPWTKQADIPYVNCGERGCSFGPIVFAGSASEMNANAAFIVRAANAHDDLLTACRDALDALEGLAAHKYTNPWCKQLRAAIDKAEKAS